MRNEDKVNHYIVRSSEDGISIRGPMSANAVAEHIARETRENERAPMILDKMPEQDKGCFYGVPEGAIVILRGDVVTLAEVAPCPCGSGKAFAECHGADGEEPAPSHAPCEHDKVYSDHILTLNPPKYPWVCRKCKARGNDVGAGTGPSGEYEKILRAACAGTGPCGDRILRATGAD